MKLRLLIDTCVWLDLAKDYRQLPVLEAVATLCEAGELDLILPEIIVDEFARNKERVIAENKRSLSSHFRVVREAIVQFAPEDQRDATLRQLREVDHRIVVSGEAINDAIQLIEKQFDLATKIGLSDSIKIRAANRAISKVAPFHRQRNGIDDAILIETYIDALGGRRNPEDIYSFVTHNIHDFSEKSGDTRRPHPDLASIFNDIDSIYSTSLSVLMQEFAEDVLDDIHLEKGYGQEPRRLPDLLEAERRLSQQIWYNRKRNLIASHKAGTHKIVSQKEWDEAALQGRHGMIIDTVWRGMIEAMKQAEIELGPDEIGPWTDFEWGMVNGKLSAIRWMLGDDWDMLDT